MESKPCGRRSIIRLIGSQCKHRAAVRRLRGNFIVRSTEIHKLDDSSGEFPEHFSLTERCPLVGFQIEIATSEVWSGDSHGDSSVDAFAAFVRGIRVAAGGDEIVLVSRPHRFGVVLVSSRMGADNRPAAWLKGMPTIWIEVDVTDGILDAQNSRIRMDDVDKVGVTALQTVESLALVETRSGWVQSGYAGQQFVCQLREGSSGETANVRSERVTWNPRLLFIPTRTTDSHSGELTHQSNALDSNRCIPSGRPTSHR